MASTSGTTSKAAQDSHSSHTACAILAPDEDIASAWEGLGAVAAFQNDPIRAARLWGAAATLHKLIGAPLAHVEERFHNRYMAIARAQLAEDAFTAAWVAGQVMAIGDAMAYALEQPSHIDRKQ